MKSSCAFLFYTKKIFYPHHYGDTDYTSSADKLEIIVSTQYTTVLSAGKIPSR